MHKQNVGRLFAGKKPRSLHSNASKSERTDYARKVEKLRKARLQRPTPEERERANQKRASKARYTSTLKAKKNLTANEIRRLVNYEYEREKLTVGEQIDHYYLRIKNMNPSQANSWLAETKFSFPQGIKTVEDVRRLCFSLYKYHHGFLIRFKGKNYTVHDGKFQTI